MYTKEYIEKRNKLLCKYFPEVMIVKTDDHTRDEIYEGLITGYKNAQKDAKKGISDPLFDSCYSIYDDRNYELVKELTE